MPLILPKNNWYSKPTISPHCVDAMFMNFRSNASNMANTMAMNLLTVYIYQFRLSVDFPVTYFWWVNGGTVNGNVDVGVYDVDGNKIASAGSTAQSGAGSVQRVPPAPSLILGPGKYQMAIATTGTGTFAGQINTSVSSRAAGWRKHSVASGAGVPLPATLSPIATDRGENPWFGITRLQVI